MKNLFFILGFLISIFAYAQDENILNNDKHADITGIWLQDNQSSYYTVILYNYDKDYIFTNFSFIEQNTVFENILEETKDYVKTVVHNPDNGWRVYCEYSYINANTLRVKYTGDIEEINFLHRQKIINDDSKILFSKNDVKTAKL
tara:strand:- start:20 stop:454 length:435 start_codon:yes stop_codon:yes gene_type:complete